VSHSAGVSDSQSVKTTESEGFRAYDVGKKIKGRKRHILTDTNNLVHVVIHIADIQDRDGAPLALVERIRHVPWLRHFFAPETSSRAPFTAAASGTSRPSRGPMRRRASRCCPGAGSSSERWHG